MPITPERVTRLREFGLSEYASRTYLALLDLGTAEARDISGISKVPASKIYRILEQLHEKGLVRILPEFPRKYAPIHFDDFLTKIHDEHRAAAATIDRQRPLLNEMFAIAGDVESTDRGSFTVVRGRRNVLEKVEEVITLAEEEIIFIVNEGAFTRAKFLSTLLAPAARSGVRSLLAVPKSVDASALHAFGEVRTRGEAAFPPGGAVLVADRAHAFVVNFLPDDGHAYEGNDIGVTTDQPGVAGVIAALVHALWQTLEPAASRGILVEGPARAVPVSEAAPAFDDVRTK